MTKTQIQIAAGIFLGLTLIYLLSKSKDAPASVKQITESVTAAVKPMIDAVKEGVASAGTAIAGAA